MRIPTDHFGVVFSFVDAGDQHALLQGVVGLTLAALPLGVAFGTLVYGQQLRRRAGEEVLLRLTPRVGDTALLNRRLAVQLLRAGLLNGVMTSAAIFASTAVIGLDGAMLWRELAICCLAVQVSTMGLLGDYTGRGGWNTERVLAAVALEVAAGGLAYVLAAPVAFPAGRTA
jgi:hypothetical protein